MVASTVARGHQTSDAPFPLELPARGTARPRILPSQLWRRLDSDGYLRFWLFAGCAVGWVGGRVGWCWWFVVAGLMLRLRRDRVRLLLAPYRIRILEPYFLEMARQRGSEGFFPGLLIPSGDGFECASGNYDSQRACSSPLHSCKSGWPVSGGGSAPGSRGRLRQGDGVFADHSYDGRFFRTP